MSRSASAGSDCEARRRSCCSPRTRRTSTRLFGSPNAAPYVKDAIPRLRGRRATDAVNPDARRHEGRRSLSARPSPPARHRRRSGCGSPTRRDRSAVRRGVRAHCSRSARRGRRVLRRRSSPTTCRTTSASCSARRSPGLLWSKQFYHYDVAALAGRRSRHRRPRRRARVTDATATGGTSTTTTSSRCRTSGNTRGIAAWDLAFHSIPLALIDPDFAKAPAHPAAARVVHAPQRPDPRLRVGVRRRQPAGARVGRAGACTRSSGRRRGRGDREFLERVFHKLLLNFTWWVNRKDAEGKNVFQGGFLGLDNIGVFDRSRRRCPTGGHLEQADGTTWMAMYCLNMLAIALELARDDPAYEDVATKFFEHFVYIAARDATTSAAGHRPVGRGGRVLLRRAALPTAQQSADSRCARWSGLIPLLAVETLEPEVLAELPGFKRGCEWFLENRPELAEHVATMRTSRARGERRLLSIVARRSAAPRAALHARRRRVPVALRHPLAVAPTTEHPYIAGVDGGEHRVDYEPAESSTGAVRRQLQLARADLVPDQLSAHRGAAEVPPLLRRHDFTVECPDRLRPRC